MGYNFTELKRNTDILAVIERYETLKKDGPHYRCCCPFHNEDTASMVVTPGKNIWKCFGCGKGGDVFDFLTNYGYTHKEAVEIVTGNDPGIGVAFPVKKLAANTRPPKTWTQAVPREQPTQISHYRYGIPHFSWPYHNADGVIVSYDCRFNHADGTKDVLPFTFCTDGKDLQWRWQGMDKPRTLSNLHLLAQFPDRAVCICEGRKAAEAAQRLLPNPIVMTWQGGGNAVRYTDWTALYGRKVTIWQDNDYAGFKATCEIADLIRDNVPLLRFIHNPEEAEKGWDAADAEAQGWTPEHTRDFVIKNAFDTPQVKEKPQNEQAEIIPGGKLPEKSPKGKSAVKQAGEQGNAENLPGQLPINTLTANLGNTTAQVAAQAGQDMQKGDGNSGFQAQEAHNIDANPYFRFLGFLSTDGKLHHCFFNNTTKTIIKMSASGMGKAANLIELAPLSYWEQNFAKKGEGFNHAGAVNYLICTSNRIGIFRHQNIRGRGAWMDGANTVIHAGTYLIVNGKYQDLSTYKSKYIYEQSGALGFSPVNPLSNEEAVKFLELTSMLKWERNVNAHLLAGWCVIAPVCGALRWRPHIWLTSGSGSGKSWVLDFIIKPVVGDVALCVQGNTSEAGLRQALRRDALPVIFDEAEAEKKNDQERMQSILTLMRSASSEDGGNIIKGTSGGGSDAYQIRSCFAFASVALQLSQQADRTRITILNLTSAKYNPTDQEEAARKAHFDDLVFAQYNLINDEYRQRLQARTMVNLPTILKNAHTFAAAAATVLGQQRAGDQLGALLAGAYSLKTEKLISYEHAVRWIKDKDWSEEVSLMETRDEHNLFISIMDTGLRVEGPHSTYDRTAGELIRNHLGLDAKDDHIASGSADMSLRRFGIIVDMEKARLIISNTSKPLKKSLENTPWSMNHSNLLLRIPGAQKVDGARFGSGVFTRAVSVPLAYFVE